MTADPSDTSYSVADPITGGVIGGLADRCLGLGDTNVALRKSPRLPTKLLGYRPLWMAVDIARGSGGGTPEGRAGVENPADTNGVNAYGVSGNVWCTAEADGDT